MCHLMPVGYLSDMIPFAKFINEVSGDGSRRTPILCASENTLTRIYQILTRS
jgi:hypothetical protein